MNIITKHGLVSVVKKDDGYQIRSSNIEAISKLFPDTDITETPNRDYRFRIVVPKQVAMAFIYAALETVDYPNFKDAIDDDNVHKLVYETWLSRVRIFG